MRVPLPLLLLFVSAGCLALGVYLKADLREVVLGLVLGGGVSGGLIYLIRLVSARENPPR